MASPLLLKATLRFSQSYRAGDPQPAIYGWCLSAAYGIIFLILGIMETRFSKRHSSFRIWPSLEYFFPVISTVQLAATVRATMIQAVCRKILRIDMSSHSKARSWSSIFVHNCRLRTCGGSSQDPVHALSCGATIWPVYDHLSK